MTAEFRHIFFNDGELVRILSSHLKKLGSRMPSGAILGLEIEDEPIALIRGHIAPDKGGESETVELGGKDLESAVIGYCISQRIPLPAKGIKRLQSFNGRLALVVTVNVKDERLDGI